MSDLGVELASQQIDTQGVESGDMFREAVLWEVCVSLHHVNNDRSPCNNISLLSFFVETPVAANDICA